MPRRQGTARQGTARQGAAVAPNVVSEVPHEARFAALAKAL